MLNFNKTLYARDYRHEAAAQCSKFTGDLVILMLVEIGISAVVSLVTSLTGAGLLSLLVLPHITFGYIYVMKMVFNDKRPQVGDLFFGFKNDYGKKIVIHLLEGLYTMLWSLLFIIPGIIKSYSYRMAKYIHMDRPELSANECITESRKIMDGHKLELFCLELSYLGWIFLCAITLGIASFWVMPRMNYATYLFYLKVSGKGSSKDDLFEGKEPEEQAETSVKNDDFFADIDSKFN